MADMENWCTNQTAKLLNNELRIKALQEISEHLANISQDEAVRTIKHLELSAVFDCLNDTNSTVVELTRVILTKCMCNLPLGDTINRYSSFLERALNHPNDNVKIMVLKEMLRHTKNEDSLVILTNQNNLLHMTIKYIEGYNMPVGIKARDILINMMKSSNGIQKLLSPDIISIITDLMSNDSITAIRFNKMFINGAKESEEFMQGLIVTGFLPQFLNKHYNPDVATSLYMDELTKLATTEHGYLYLKSARFIGKIYEKFKTTSVEMHRLSNLCRLDKLDILNFFINIALWRPKEAMEEYPEIIHYLFSNIVSDDVTLLRVSLDKIGRIGESNEGKLALTSRGVQFITVLQIMCDRLSSFPEDLRIRALQCIERLIRITVFNSEITNLVHKWFSMMNDDSMNLVYRNARSHIIGISLASLRVIRALALHNWGQKYFKKAPGFIDFLLYRRSDGDKESNEIRYEIIKILATSTLFEHNTLTRFQKYVEEGPFYVQAITSVAVEGED